MRLITVPSLEPLCRGADTQGWSLVGPVQLTRRITRSRTRSPTVICMSRTARRYVPAKRFNPWTRALHPSRDGGKPSPVSELRSCVEIVLGEGLLCGRLSHY
jgi:hypothetical protein